MKKDKPVSFAIFGGSFNPIHLGHLHLAELVREEFCLNEIIFMPSGRPPHKDVSAQADKEHRYEMVAKAVRSNPHFKVSRLELDHSGYSYTVDTLREVRGGLSVDATVYFIVGADSLIEMHKWKDPENIFALCEIIAIARSGIHNDAAIKASEALRSNYGAKIHLLEKRTYPISSTEIRARIQAGLSVKYFVPDEVCDYIETHSLYCQNYDLERIKNYLKENLSPERYAHSEGTAKLAVHLAKIHGVDSEKAYLAGILHDIAKEMPIAEMSKYRGAIGDDEFSFTWVVHQFIGANVAAELFGIIDSDILNAMRYHATTRPSMSPLEKIIFIADKIEEGRGFPENPYLKAVAESDLDRAVYEILQITTSIAKEKGKKIHPLSMEVLKSIENLF